MRPSWITQMASKSNDKYLCRKKMRRYKHRGEVNMMMEAGIGVKQPQLRNGATRSLNKQRSILSLRVPRANALG